MGDFTIFFASLVAARAHKDRAKVIGISCRDALSVWVGFRACFLETGCVIGLSGLFRSPRIPLGISVEDHVLEIVGLDSESGLKLGDFFFRLCWRQSKKQPSDPACLPEHGG